MDRPVKVAVWGAGNRGFRYASYAAAHPEELQVMAVAEPRPAYRERFARAHKLPPAYCFQDWREALEEQPEVEAVFICTPDRQHTEPFMAAVAAGYHVLVEKPLAPTAEECRRTVAATENTQEIVAVGHVLRFAPFWQEVKRLVASGELGEIQAIQHLEPVNYWHFAHSYVRGNWRREDESGPLFLTKACHDTDLLGWLTGRRCLSVISLGGLNHFTAEHAPSGAPDRCLDNCPAEAECPYSALKLYLNPALTDWPVDVIATDLSREGRLQALAEGPYGRCVYHCDNTVPDVQTALFEFEGGITAALTVSAFTQGHRTIRIMGSAGELLGDSHTIQVYDFRRGLKRRYAIPQPAEGHYGGDFRLVRAFIRAIREEKHYPLASPAEVLQSHLMSLAAEESRRAGGKRIMIE